VKEENRVVKGYFGKPILYTRLETRTKEIKVDARINVESRNPK